MIFYHIKLIPSFLEGHFGYIFNESTAWRGKSIKMCDVIYGGPRVEKKIFSQFI